MSEVAPLLVMTEEEEIQNISDYPLSISSVDVSFTQASEKNQRNLLREIEEKNEIIRSI
jgi:hypothetical protein